MEKVQKLLVSELFLTIQGEGRRIGTSCVLLRLYGCSVQCKWCDSKFAWNKGEEYECLTVKQILRKIYKMKSADLFYLLVSGGEPLLQEGLLLELIDLLVRLNSKWQIEIETSGVYQPIYHPNICYSVSPKLSNASPKFTNGYKHLSNYASLKNTYFKFVVEKEEDFEEIIKIVALNNISSDLVYISGQGKNDYELLETEQWLFDFLPKYWPQFKLSTRLHIHLFGGERGK